jgi:hypothetical protein
MDVRYLVGIIFVIFAEVLFHTGHPVAAMLPAGAGVYLLAAQLKETLGL